MSTQVAPVMIASPPRRAPSLARRVVEGIAALVGIVGALLFVIAPMFSGPHAPAKERAVKPDGSARVPAAPVESRAAPTRPLERPSTPR